MYYKMIHGPYNMKSTVRILAVSYGWTVLSRTEVKCIFAHPVVNLQKGSYKKSQLDTLSWLQNPYVCFKTLLWESVNSNIQAWLIPTIFVTNWSARNFT